MLQGNLSVTLNISQKQILCASHKYFYSFSQNIKALTLKETNLILSQENYFCLCFADFE